MAAGGVNRERRTHHEPPDRAGDEFGIIDLMRTARLNSNILTEADVSDAFCQRVEGKLIYVHGIDSWFRWDGMLWREDQTRSALHAIKALAQAVTDDMTTEKEAKTRRAIRRKGFASGVEAFAQADPRVARHVSQLDQHRDLLGTPIGVYNLKTGKLKLPDPALLMTKLTLVSPAMTVLPWRWYRFLLEACGGDKDMVRWLQVWLGYSTTGHVREEQFAFFYGPGGNGKGTLLTTVEKLLGEYGMTASIDLFMTAGGFSRHTTDVAALAGARFVTAQETEEGSKWDEGKLKALTGGDRITARFMRQDNFTFDPQLTLTMSGNHAPQLKNVDEAIIRRLNVVPFLHTPKRIDQKLKTHLIEGEGEAILGWLIRGAIRWYAQGLPSRPAAIDKATREYLKEQDRVSEWIADCCVVGRGEQEKLANLHESYVAYTGDRAMSSQKLAKALDLRGFKRLPKGKYGVKFDGIKAENAAEAVA